MTKMNLSSYSGGGGGAKTAGKAFGKRKGAVSQGTAARRARASLGGGKKNLAARQSAAMSEMAAKPTRKGANKKPTRKPAK